jgi:subtilase family serine protease
MKHRSIAARRLVACLAFLLAGCGGSGIAPAIRGNPGALQSFDDASYVRAQIASGAYIQACPDVVLGRWRCMALGLRDTAQAPRSEDAGSGTVRGYGPSQLQAAYNITKEAKHNRGGLVALVEFGGDPHIAADLAVYRKQFGLPRCDRATECLRIVNQDGRKRPLPPVSHEWLAEQALDVDMVSANCPHCRIIVIEASTNLFTSERTAAAFHPVAISNSWGTPEYKEEERGQFRLFDHPGIAITASSGDGGYGVIFPSSAATVTAVGGTSLHPAQNARGYTEHVWGGAGSGCSRFIATPSWQLPIESQLGGCSNRVVADVAYDASPPTGVAVYESTRGDGEAAGWQVWGGTSVGAPAIAAIYALSGDTAGIPASLSYANTQDLYDITRGSNGDCSPLPAYICTGEVGYDGPTGNGTPDGLGAF